MDLYSHCFPCYYDQIPDRKQLKGRRICFGSQFEVIQAIMVSKTWWKKGEAPDHLVSTERKQKEDRK